MSALLLRKNKYYKHEQLCRLVGNVSKSCCDRENEETVATTYLCGNVRGKVVLYLRGIASDDPVLTEVVVPGTPKDTSGPSVHIYRKKCSGKGSPR